MGMVNTDIDNQVSFILHDKIGIKINFNSKELGCESFVLKGNEVKHVDLDYFEKLKENKLFRDLVDSGKIEILLEPESETETETEPEPEPETETETETETKKRGRPKKQELQ